jgi:hypothetical protein
MPWHTVSSGFIVHKTYRAALVPALLSTDHQITRIRSLMYMLHHGPETPRSAGEYAPEPTSGNSIGSAEWYELHDYS